MTYTTVINGVTVTASPAFARTVGPSGAPIDFTSRLGIFGNPTGASLPIRVDFSVPIITFGIRIVGQTHPNHKMQAFTAGGVLIGESIDTPTVPDLGNGGSESNVSIGGSASVPIAYIMLVPPANDYVGYRDMRVLTLVDEPPPPPPPGDVDLATLIIVDTTPINRTYVMDSMIAIPPSTFNVTNISTDTNLQISIDGEPGIDGMSFSPADFPLGPAGMNSLANIQSVTVNFDLATINDLAFLPLQPRIAIHVSKLGVLPPPPPPPPTQISWYEERFNGSPLRPWPVGKPIGPRPTYEQLFSNPTSTRTVSTINYFNTLTAPITLRWNQNINVTDISDYTFTMVTDDGMRFFINDAITMNEWRDQDDLTAKKTVRLQPGQYRFRVEYFNNGAGSTARFGYTSKAVLL